VILGVSFVVCFGLVPSSSFSSLLAASSGLSPSFTPPAEVSRDKARSAPLGVKDVSFVSPVSSGGRKCKKKLPL